MLRLLLESITLLAFFLPLFLFLITVLSYILYYLFSPTIFIGKDIIGSTNKELSLLIIGCFLLLFLVIFCRVKIEKQKFIKAFSLSKEEILLYFLTSFLFAYFFSKSFLILSKLGSIPIILGSSLLFIIFPNVVEFFLSYKMDFFKELLRRYFYDIKIKVVEVRISFSDFLKYLQDFKNKVIKLNLSIQEIKKQGFSPFIILIKGSIKRLLDFSMIVVSSLLFVLYRLMIVLLIFLSIVLVFYLLISQVQKYLAYERKLRESLTIMKLTPKKTTVGEKVLIEGYNFGWRTSTDDRLMSNYGPVIVELWKDQEIIFFVPLHWQEGKMALWIERRKETTRYSPLSKSNTAYLELLNRWYFYPEEKNFASNPFYNYWERILKKIRRTIFSTGYF